MTAVLVAWFVTAYLGFWWFGLRHRGAAFAFGSVLASVFFAFVITAGAARGYLTVAWMQLLRREPVYPCAAPGQL